MSDMDKAVYDSKKALPNKLLKEDGTVTDLAGNIVIGAVDAYENKPALPNKWMNPDGSYSTLNEIVASMIDNELFIIVDELPAVGEENKIYLLTQDDKLIEYIWVNNKWDPVGMVEFDITNYYTKAEVTQLIETSLNSAKAYADTLFNSIEIPPQVFYWNGATNQSGQDFWTEIMNANKSNSVLVNGYSRLYSTLVNTHIYCIIEKNKIASTLSKQNTVELFFSFQLNTVKENSNSLIQEVTYCVMLSGNPEKITRYYYLQ